MNGVSEPETYKKAMDQLKETLNLFESKINAILFAQQTNGAPLSFDNEIELR